MTTLLPMLLFTLALVFFPFPSTSSPAMEQQNFPAPPKRAGSPSKYSKPFTEFGICCLKYLLQNASQIWRFSPLSMDGWFSSLGSHSERTKPTKLLPIYFRQGNISLAVRLWDWKEAKWNTFHQQPSIKKNIKPKNVSVSNCFALYAEVCKLRLKPLRCSSAWCEVCRFRWFFCIWSMKWVKQY